MKPAKHGQPDSWHENCVLQNREREGEVRRGRSSGSTGRSLLFEQRRCKDDGQGGAFDDITQDEQGQQRVTFETSAQRSDPYVLHVSAVGDLAVPPESRAAATYVFHAEAEARALQRDLDLPTDNNDGFVGNDDVIPHSGGVVLSPEEILHRSAVGTTRPATVGLSPEEIMYGGPVGAPRPGAVAVMGAGMLDDEALEERMLQRARMSSAHQSTIDNEEPILIAATLVADELNHNDIEREGVHDTNADNDEDSPPHNMRESSEPTNHDCRNSPSQDALDDEEARTNATINMATSSTVTLVERGSVSVVTATSEPIAVATKQPQWACYAGGRRLTCCLPTPGKSMRPSRGCVLAAILLTVAAVAGAMLGLFIGGDDGTSKAGSFQGSVGGGVNEDARLEWLKEILAPVSGLDSLNNPNSHHHQAMLWLRDDAFLLDDPAGLVLEDPMISNSGDMNATAVWKIAQRYIMVLLHFATGGKDWAFNYQFLTSGVDECQWSDRNSVPWGAMGISCNDMGQVKSLSLYSNNLKGSIPEELTHLKTLKTLILSGNALTGPIPSVLGDLADLTTIHLCCNRLTGTIPEELGNLSEMTFLSLFDNSLTGTLPEALGGMTSMEVLTLSRNNLSGMLPTSLRRLDRLEELYLYGNRFTGSFNFLCNKGGANFTKFETDCNLECDCFTKCY